jgi:hypothetical protein
VKRVALCCPVSEKIPTLLGSQGVSSPPPGIHYPTLLRSKESAMRRLFNPLKRFLFSVVALAVLGVTFSAAPAPAQTGLPDTTGPKPAFAPAAKSAPVKTSEAPEPDLQISGEISAALTKAYANTKLPALAVAPAR